MKNIMKQIFAEVQLMKDVQSKPTKIYLGILFTLFAVFFYAYGYYTAKITSGDNCCSCKEENKEV